MNVNFPMRLYCTEEEGITEWVVEYPDLPGCIGVGDTPEEALSEGKIHKDLWIESAVDNGVSIPEPSKMYEEEYSGRFNIRIPKSLHRNAALRAAEEGISLNQLCLQYISMGVAVASAEKSLSCYFTIPTGDAKWKASPAKEELIIPDAWEKMDMRKLVS